MTQPLINADEGLDKIAALANDPANAITIEGANEPGSMAEAVQEHLNEAPTDELEDSPTPESSEEKEPTAEEKAEQARIAEEERKANLSVEEKTKEEKALEVEAAKQKAADERLDKHPRFQEINRKVQELTPLAAQARYDQDFMAKSKITVEQKTQAFNLMALLNSDPDKGILALEKVLEDWKLSTGKLLPKDLADEVQAGTISKERATELHMTRMQVAQAKQTQTKVQQQQVTSHQRSLIDSQNQWGAQKMSRDPDFKPGSDKWNLCLDKMKVLALEAPPTTAAAAIKICEDAYAFAHKLTSRFSPPPKARRTLAGASRSSEQQNGGPREGETLQAYVARTVGFERVAA